MYRRIYLIWVFRYESGCVDPCQSFSAHQATRTDPFLQRRMHCRSRDNFNSFAANLPLKEALYIRFSAPVQEVEMRSVVYPWLRMPAPLQVLRHCRWSYRQYYR